jgi:hypothetical protein
MRKYLASTVVGAMLLAGQAAAQSAQSDASIVALGDRLGTPAGVVDRDASCQCTEDHLIEIGFGVTVLALIIWGFSQTGPGRPTSP